MSALQIEENNFVDDDQSYKVSGDNALKHISKQVQEFVGRCKSEAKLNASKLVLDSRSYASGRVQIKQKIN